MSRMQICDVLLSFAEAMTSAALAQVVLDSLPSCPGC